MSKRQAQMPASTTVVSAMPLSLPSTSDMTITERYQLRRNSAFAAKTQPLSRQTHQATPMATATTWCRRHMYMPQRQ